MAKAWQTSQQSGADGLPPLVSVKLAPGIYRVCDAAAVPALPQTDSFYCLNFSGLKNFQFVGSDSTSEIRIMEPYIGIALIDSAQNVTLAKMTFDYEVPPFLQGTVTGISYTSNGKTIETLNLQTDSSSQKFSDIAYNQLNSGNFIELIDSLRAAPKKNVPSYMPLLSNSSPFTDVNTAYATLLSDQITWQVRLDQNLGWANLDPVHPQVSVGDRFVFKSLDPRSGGIMARFSDTITLSQLNIFGSASIATAFVDNTGPIVEDHVNVMIRPNSDRLISSNADGAHFQNDRGPITIQYSTYSAMGDDAIAIYSIGMNVWSVSSANQFVVYAPRHIYNGDKFQFLDRNTGRIRGMAAATEAASFQCPSGYNYCYNVTVDMMPQGVQAGDILYLYNAAGGSNVLIHNNLISDHRGNGILLLAPGSQVIDNKFLNSQTGVIMVGPFLPYYNQGPVPDHVSISGNVIDSGGIFYGQIANGAWSSCAGCYEPQILVTSAIAGPSGTVTALSGPSAITIEGNSFTNPVTPSVEVDSASGVSLLNNKFSSSLSIIRIPGPAVLFNSGSALSVKGFTIENLGSNLTSIIEINCPMGVSVSNIVDNGVTDLVTDHQTCQ